MSADALTGYVAGLVTRTMRANGFIGAVHVSSVETVGSTYIARVLATVGTKSVPYVATIGAGRVKVRRADA